MFFCGRTTNGKPNSIDNSSMALYQTYPVPLSAQLEALAATMQVHVHIKMNVHLWGSNCVGTSYTRCRSTISSTFKQKQSNTHEITHTCAQGRIKRWRSTLCIRAMKQRRRRAVNVGENIRNTRKVLLTLRAKWIGELMTARSYCMLHEAVHEHSNQLTGNVSVGLAGRVRFQSATTFEAQNDAQIAECNGCN